MDRASALKAPPGREGGCEQEQMRKVAFVFLCAVLVTVVGAGGLTWVLACLFGLPDVVELVLFEIGVALASMVSVWVVWAILGRY